MGEVGKKTLDEAALSEKRKPDLQSEGEPVDDGSCKKLKSEDETKTETEAKAHDTYPVAKFELNFYEDLEEEEESDKEDKEYKIEEDGESENSEEKEQQAVDDRKGKGIMKLDKGKGKLEVDEESDSEDVGDTDGLYSSDEDCDLTDDPLLEVDLNTVLPSKTRGRQPEAMLVNTCGSESDDSGSDDSDN